jgi:hypothetical protein
MIFQRLPQDLQDRTGKLREFIQKQYPVMAQRHFGPHMDSDTV